MIACACLDCGHVGLKLKNTPAIGEGAGPRNLVEHYRKVVAMLVTATDQAAIDEYRRILEELRTQWRAQHGADSLHETAFGEADDDQDKD